MNDGSDLSSRPRCGLNLLYIRPGYMGGTVRYAFSLFSELLALDYFEWTVYVREGVHLPSEFYKPGVNLRIINIHGSLVGRVAYEQLLLPVKVKNDDLDLLFSPGFVSPLWGGFLKVVTVHDLYYKLYPQFVRPLQRLYWKIFIPLSMRAADSVITISKTTRRDLISFYPWLEGALHSIYLGVTGANTSSQEGVAKANVSYCMVVGNLTPNKNIGLVIDAIKRINSDGVVCKLKIIGSDIEGVLERYLREHGGRELVELHEGLPDSELLANYRGALCTIQASVYEGFGLPVLEAMAQGSPVVVSDADALVEVVGNAAQVFNRNSAKGLAECVRRLMDDESLRNHYRELGLQRVKDFSWSVTAESTARLFFGLLKG